MLGLVAATGQSEGRTPVLREQIGWVKPRVAWGLVVLLVVATSAGFVGCGDQPATEASSVDPLPVVRGLPVDSTAVFFVEAGLIGQRPALKEEIEHGHEILAQRTAGVLSVELLASVEITSAAFGLANGSSGAAVVSGDFGLG